MKKQKTGENMGKCTAKEMPWPAQREEALTGIVEDEAAKAGESKILGGKLRKWNS